MSINALTNAALARRHDFEPFNAVPENLEEISRAAGSPPRAAAAGAVGVVAGAGGATNGTNTTLQTLTTYIPTEVLTLYVSAVAAVGPLMIHGQPVGRWLPFWVFLAVTPLGVWTAFATKLRAADRAIPIRLSQWPLWEMIAAVIAYVAWAFALPNTPFAQYQDWYSTGLASFLILVVSAVLGLIAPLMQRQLPS